MAKNRAKFSVERLRFFNEFPLGVSNEIVQKSAEITVHSGTALVLLVKEQE